MTPPTPRVGPDEPEARSPASMTGAPGGALLHLLIGATGLIVAAVFWTRSLTWWDPLLAASLTGIGLLQLAASAAALRGRVAVATTPDHPIERIEPPAPVEPVERAVAHDMADPYGPPVRAEIRVLRGADQGPIPHQRTPIASAEPAATPPGHDIAPIDDDSVGALLAQTRIALGLSIDDLRAQTAIRPHVLAAMERDDFGPCGGDLYARGHLAAVAGVLGLDPGELHARYDRVRADAATSPQHTLRDDLAPSYVSAVRPARPRWLPLAGAAAIIAMIWGVAHVINDAPPPPIALPSTDTAGLAGNREPIVSPRTVTTRIVVEADGRDAEVTILDRDGAVVWQGILDPGERHRATGLAPFTVETDDGAAVTVTVRGTARGSVGPDPAPATRRFARRP